MKNKYCFMKHLAKNVCCTNNNYHYLTTVSLISASKCFILKMEIGFLYSLTLNHCFHYQEPLDRTVFCPLRKCFRCQNHLEFWNNRSLDSSFRQKNACGEGLLFPFFQLLYLIGKVMSRRNWRVKC